MELETGFGGMTNGVLRCIEAPLAFVLCAFYLTDFMSCLQSGRYLGTRGEVAYQLELPQSLAGVHDVFHVSQLKKCLRVPEIGRAHV